MGRPLVGLLGYGGAGKDTVARELVVLHGWTRVAFADPLRAVLYDLNPLMDDGDLRVAEAVDIWGWDRIKRGSPEVRQLLQRLGASMRERVDPYVWVNAAMRRVRHIDGPVVVTDVRYRNEVAAIQQAGGQLVLVRRDGVGPVNSHATERLAGEAEAFVDLVVDNDGTPEQAAQALLDGLHLGGTTADLAPQV